MDLSQAAVTNIQQLCADVCRIEIEYATRLPSFDPGSHIDLLVYIDGRPQTRSYSVVEHSSSNRLVIAVRRIPESHGGSAYMHQLQVGDRLDVTLPSNHFPLGFSAPEVLLLAGGIGITPIIGMARRLKARDVPFQLIYLGRSRTAMPFLDQLVDEFPEQLVSRVGDEHGRTDFDPLLSPLPNDSEVYMCGPVPLMEAVGNVWTRQGRPPERLRFETFGGAGAKTAHEFLVYVPAQGLEVTVPPEKSMLEALEVAGVEPLYSCRRGECGLCSVDVLEVKGELDHRDIFLSERQKNEGKQLCTCVSRAVGSVTVELP